MLEFGQRLFQRPWRGKGMQQGQCLVAQGDALPAAFHRDPATVEGDFDVVGKLEQRVFFHGVSKALMLQPEHLRLAQRLSFST